MFLKSLALIIFIFSLSTFAASDKAPYDEGLPPNPPPEYEQEINGLLNLFNQVQLAPVYLRAKFNDLVAEKNKKMGAYERENRRRFFKYHQQALKELNEKNAEEMKQWRKDNPKGNFGEFQKTLHAKRQALVDQQNAVKAPFEIEMKTKRKNYDEFMKIRKEEFQKKITEYKKSYDARMDAAEGKTPPASSNPVNPAAEEFKSIPKGKGILLSPTKE